MVQLYTSTYLRVHFKVASKGMKYARHKTFQRPIFYGYPNLAACIACIVYFLMNMQVVVSLG